MQPVNHFSFLESISTETQNILTDAGETLNGFYSVGYHEVDEEPSLKMYGDNG